MVHGLYGKFTSRGGGKLGIYRYAPEVSVNGKMTKGAGTHLEKIWCPCCGLKRRNFSEQKGKFTYSTNTPKM